MDAFVYLRVRPGKLEDVVAGVQAIPSVQAVVAVVGEWDVLAAVHGPDLMGIANDVIRQVHPIDGVQRTVTAPVVPGDLLAMTPGTRTPVPLRQASEACFVHVKTAPGASAGLFERAAEIEDVAAVALIAGEYDLIVEIPYPWERSARVIVEHILELPGVVATRTLVAVPQLEPAEEDRDQFSAWS